MILLLMNFFVSKKIKIKTEIVLSPGGAYFQMPKSALSSTERTKMFAAEHPSFLRAEKDRLICTACVNVSFGVRSQVSQHISSEKHVQLSQRQTLIPDQKQNYFSSELAQAHFCQHSSRER